MNTSNEYSSKKRYREEESVLTSSMSDADQQKQRNNRPVVRTKDQDDDTMNRVKKKQKDMNRSSTIALEESKLHLSDKELNHTKYNFLLKLFDKVDLINEEEISS